MPLLSWVLLACTPDPSKGQADIDDTDDPPADTDTEDSDTGSPPAPTGETLHPVPGVTVDRASPLWFHVAGQSLVCMLVFFESESEIRIDALGMDDGTFHAYATGYQLATPATPAPRTHNLDWFQGELFLPVHLGDLHRIDVDNGTVATRPFITPQFAWLGGAATDGQCLWPTWDEVGQPGSCDVPIDDPYRWLGSDADRLFVLDDCGIQRLRADGTATETCWRLPRVVRDHEIVSFDVVADRGVVMWVDGEYGLHVSSFGLGRSELQDDHILGDGSTWVQGVGCEAGPLGW